MLIDDGSAKQRLRNTPESQHVPLLLMCARSPPPPPLPSPISVPVSSESPFVTYDNCAAQHFPCPDFSRTLWGRMCPSVQTMWSITKSWCSTKPLQLLQHAKYHSSRKGSSVDTLFVATHVWNESVTWTEFGKVFELGFRHFHHPLCWLHVLILFRHRHFFHSSMLHQTTRRKEGLKVRITVPCWLRADTDSVQ